MRIEKYLNISFAFIILLALFILPTAHVSAANGDLLKYTYGPAKDGVTNFDSDNNPGDDMSNNNGIIRSFDTILEPLSIQFAASDTPYIVKFKLTGSIDNGVVDNRVLNAMFDNSWNPTFDDSSNASTFSQDETFTVNSSNGGYWGQTIPIHVFGATNGLSITPHFWIQVESVTTNGSTQAETINQDPQEFVSANDPTNLATSFTVSSQTSLGVAIPQLNDSMMNFNDYAHAVAPNTKNAVLGALAFSIGLKPLANRGTSFLGAAYPDPGSYIWLLLTPSITSNGTQITDTSDLGQVQVFQDGFVGLPLVTASAFNTPNANTTPIAGQVPASGGGGNQRGQTLINAVFNTGQPGFGDVTLGGVNQVAFAFSNWYTGDEFPNIDATSAGTVPADPWKSQIKAFISFSARILFPLVNYTSSSNQIMSYSLKNNGLVIMNASGTETGSETADQSNILATANTQLGTPAFAGQINYTYNDTPKLGQPRTWAGYRQSDGKTSAGTNAWNSPSDAALYMGEHFDGWSFFADSQILYGGMNLLQFWNPEASSYDDDNSPQLQQGTDIVGNPLTPTYQYGVCNSNDNRLSALQQRNFNSFTFYDSPAEAKAHGQISAVLAHFNQAIPLSPTPGILVPRVVTTQVAGTNNRKDTFGNDPYVTFTQVEAYYDTGHTMTITSPAGTFPYTPSQYINGSFNNATTSTTQMQVDNATMQPWSQDMTP